MPKKDYKTMSWYSEKEIQEIANDLDKAVTIPVNSKLKVQHRVYDFSEIEKILRDAKRIAIQKCGCKTTYQNCDAPRDICLSLDDTADDLLHKNLYDAREIDINQALNVLKKSHSAGLVHMAYTMKGEETPGLICSCCPCCCHTLGSLIRNGTHAKILTSRYIAQDDPSKCIFCGKCVERCVFQARQIKNRVVVYDPSFCFGCGLCISTCPTEAINLVERVNM
ncbi:4Fe-4S dicluster domain-containing protein [Candidatus Bathyarchaeota archaeon]|nr:4Fe-4S dicluster domain-containing protein [Candidatus Bathyarchaeota archaeon]